jgi:hypothetical protein
MLVDIIDTFDIFEDPTNYDFPELSDIEDIHIGREGLRGDPTGTNEVAQIAFYVRFYSVNQQTPEPSLERRRAIYLATVKEKDCSPP